jgi:uncharacterized protein YndB with AHSA1/START domain
MEFDSIEREILVAATPEVVFEVVSSPAHLQEWWSDSADVVAAPGAVGRLVWEAKGDGPEHVAPITVVDAVPPRLFSFRWVYPQGETAGGDNSLLVTFEIVPVEAGTVVRVRETGFREKSWAPAERDAEYKDHVSGWDHFVPRLGGYLDRLVAIP